METEGKRGGYGGALRTRVREYMRVSGDGERRRVENYSKPEYRGKGGEQGKERRGETEGRWNSRVRSGMDEKQEQN